MAGNFVVNQHDLEFILKQIRIAEDHSSGKTLLQAIMDEYGVSAADAALLPAGLRTVDGSLNNLLSGQEDFGASNTLFPRLLDPVYTDGLGGTFDTNGPAPGGGVTNTDYTPTPDGTNMNVVDADPRTISNLIVDQSVANPAAIYAALRNAGIEGNAATAAVEMITSAYQATLSANGAAVQVTQTLNLLTAANAELGAATVAEAATQAVVDAYSAADALTGAAETAATGAQTALDAFVSYLSTTSFISVSAAAAAEAATQATENAYTAANGLTDAAETAAADAQVAVDALVDFLGTTTFVSLPAATAAAAATQAVVNSYSAADGLTATAETTASAAQAAIDALVDTLSPSQAVLDATAAAATTQAAVDAYTAADALTGAAETAATDAQAAVDALVATLDAAATNGVPTGDEATLYADAIAAADAAIAAAQAVVDALAGTASTEADAALAGALALADALAALAVDGVDAADLGAAQTASSDYGVVSVPGTLSTGIANDLADATTADGLADTALTDAVAAQATAQASAYATATATASAALTAAQAVVTALAGNSSPAASATLAGAQALIDALALLDDDGIDGSDLAAAESAAVAYLDVSGPGGSADQSTAEISTGLSDAQTADAAADEDVVTATTQQADAQIAFDVAANAATAALSAAEAVVTALAGNSSPAALATVAGAQALIDALAPLLSGGFDASDLTAAQDASTAYLLVSGLGGTADQSTTEVADGLAAAEIADDAADAALVTATTQQADALAAFNAAATAASAALVAAQAVVTALGDNPSTEASATVAGAQALIDALAPLDDNGFDAGDLTPAQDASTAYAAAVSGPGGSASAATSGIDASLAAALAADAAAETVLATETAEQAAAQAAYDAAVAAANTSGTPEQTAAALAAALESYGLETDAEGGLLIEARSPDIGLSPSFNNVMTIFGQFFDHGLDLVNKGGNGTVFIPLNADDPLIAGDDGVFGTADDLPAHLRFMALTRATQTIDANGVAQHTNATTSFVDQNQTYTSHASHQVFLREYVRIGNETLSTGKLLDGETNGVPDGTIATWADLKASALEFLGIALTDQDVGRVPLLLTDAYGNLILGANGYAQMVMAPLTEGGPNWLKEGTAEGISTEGSIESGVAFLVDIAHTASPDGLTADADSIAGNAVATNPTTGSRLEYDNELLDAHFVTGDGRGNENIGLTAVHATFHAEHNRVVDANKATILATGDRAFINEWLLVDLGAEDPIPTDIDAVTWDGARLFQAARFSTEMQYQHMVFEEFARRLQPAIDPFVFTNTADIDASILAEFAHTVYRFGHSMLTESVDRLDNNLELVNGDTEQMSLIEAFLNPIAYNDTGADFDAIQGALFRGMARDVGSEIDEFIVPALRSNLLGLPLDLAALNIARGRDTGVPSLNETRAQLYNDFAVADLKPYSGWNDFAQHMRNPVSVINFIAAYGNHASILAATTLVEKRDAATLLVFGDGTNGNGVTIDGVTYSNADRLAFLNGTGIYAAGGATGDRGGLDNVDLWIGGLAEVRPEFGGMLGSTFNFIFEYQMEALQNGDRLYYLSRTQGLNLLDQLEQNTFTDIVARNSDLSDPYATHMSAQLFITPDMILELDRQIAQTDYNGAEEGRDPSFEGIQEILTPKVVRDYSDTTTDENGHDVGGVLHFLGGEHVVIGGTEGDDTLTSDIGDDAIYGDGGNDYINSGTGADQVFGGTGDDIIEDPFGDDFLRGGAGNDVISAARGLDVIFGGEAQDAILLGQDGSEVFAGEGNDFVLGGAGADVLQGNEGDDWIEGGEGFDGIAGDNSELFFNSTIIGHDVAWGQGNDQDYDMESGDDISFTGVGIQRAEGMFGFDWAVTKYDVSVGPVNLGLTAANTDIANILRDRFDLVEALSGWKNDDILLGDDRSAADVGALGFDDHVLTAEGIARIDGLADLLGPGITSFRDGNILLGGGGSDLITGGGGNDVIDGDAWLNVRIKVMVNGTEYSAESLNSDRVVAGPYAGKLFNVDANGDPIFSSVAFNGRSLTSLLLDRTVNPGDMSIVRELKSDSSGIDRAVFTGTSAQYTIEGRGAVVAGFAQVAYDLDGDGFISVSENVAAVNDDADLLKNIEELVFSDVTLNLADVVEAVPLATDVVYNAIVPGAVDLPAANSQIATLTHDGANATMTLGAGSSTSFALNAAGALTTTGVLAQSQTHTLNVQVVNSGGTYSETMLVRIGSASTTVGDIYTGGAVTDVIYGLAGNDSLNGAAGDDVIYGQTGNDTLVGGDNNDLLVGGIGTDSVVGGNGDDRIIWVAGHGTDTQTDGGLGNDRLEISGTAANEVLTVNFNGTVITAITQIGAIAGIETITADLLGAADQISYATTTATGVTVNLGTGTATGFASIANIANVSGTSLVDNLTGDSAANQLLGQGGNDVFIATVDNAADQFDGGTGIDVVDYSAYTTGLSINLGAVEPIIVSGSGAASDLLRGIENLIGGSGNDVFLGSGLTNTFTGGLGSDVLDGGAANDVLLGEAGTDTLIGGTGRDTMTGGGATDVFVFATAAQSANGANSDRITDFEGAGITVGDLIDLSAIASGFTFIGSSNFVGGATNQVRIAVSGTDTLIQIDNDADTGVESQIVLTGVHALTAADFIF